MQHILGILHFWEQLFTAVWSISWVGVIRQGNCTNGSLWFLKSRMWQARNFDFKSSEHWRSISSICSCNGNFSESTSKGKEKILKVGWRATQICLEGYRLGTFALNKYIFDLFTLYFISSFLQIWICNLQCFSTSHQKEGREGKVTKLWFFCQSCLLRCCLRWHFIFYVSYLEDPNQIVFRNCELYWSQCLHNLSAAAINHWEVIPYILVYYDFLRLYFGLVLGGCTICEIQTRPTLSQLFTHTKFVSYIWVNPLVLGCSLGLMLCEYTW